MFISIWNYIKNLLKNTNNVIENCNNKEVAVSIQSRTESVDESVQLSQNCAICGNIYFGEGGVMKIVTKDQLAMLIDIWNKYENERNDSKTDDVSNPNSDLNYSYMKGIPQIKENSDIVYDTNKLLPFETNIRTGTNNKSSISLKNNRSSRKSTSKSLQSNFENKVENKIKYNEIKDVSIKANKIESNQKNVKLDNTVETFERLSDSLILARHKKARKEDIYSDTERDIVSKDNQKPVQSSLSLGNNKIDVSTILTSTKISFSYEDYQDGFNIFDVGNDKSSESQYRYSGYKPNTDENLENRKDSKNVKQLSQENEQKERKLSKLGSNEIGTKSMKSNKSKKTRNLAQYRESTSLSSDKEMMVPQDKEKRPRILSQQSTSEVGTKIIWKNLSNLYEVNKKKTCKKIKTIFEINQDKEGKKYIVPSSYSHNQITNSMIEILMEGEEDEEVCELEEFYEKDQNGEKLEKCGKYENYVELNKIKNQLLIDDINSTKIPVISKGVDMTTQSSRENFYNSDTTNITTVTENLSNIYNLNHRKSKEGLFQWYFGKLTSILKK